MAGINWYAGYQINKSCMTKPVPLCGLSNLQLRFLCPTDLEEVRTLCQDWFPIDYPYSWYEDITSNPRFYSLAAVYNGIIIGLIVAEIKSYFKLNREDRGILSQAFNKQTELGYILSLGVSKDQRRNGIASLLLDNLIAHLTTVDHVDCKALFLHVLTTNSAAIHFYEHRNFRLHSFLPYYYSIKGKCKDGFTYVLYINGGHPPWGLYDYLKHYCGVLYQADLCSVPSWMWHKMQAVLHWVWPGMRRIVVQNTTARSCTNQACPLCFRYSTSSNLARHRQTHRSLGDKKARRCPHCDKVYVSMPAFSMHVRTHNQGCKCPYCGKCFSRPWLLQGHIRTHTGEKPFKCSICTKAFADKSNLRAHVQTHSNTKPHMCGRCGKAFALKSYLYKHEESSCMRAHPRVEGTCSPPQDKMTQLSPTPPLNVPSPGRILGVAIAV